MYSSGASEEKRARKEEIKDCLRHSLLPRAHEIIFLLDSSACSPSLKDAVDKVAELDRRQAFDSNERHFPVGGRRYQRVIDVRDAATKTPCLFGYRKKSP